VAGFTESDDFPVTPGGAQENYAGSYVYYHRGDMAIARLNADLTTLISATYLGGSDKEEFADMALDADGIPVVFGKTWSADFPTTAGAYDQTQRAENLVIARVSLDRQFDLTVSHTGTGTGTVTYTPPGTSYREEHTETYDDAPL